MFDITFFTVMHPSESTQTKESIKARNKTYRKRTLAGGENIIPRFARNMNKSC